MYDTIILVSGSREGAPNELVKDWLDTFIDIAEGPVLVIHGAARGVDTQADTAVRARIDAGDDIDLIGVPADWKRWGRAAGNKRNRDMLDILLKLEANFKLVLAFPHPEKSVGTYHMIRIAREERVKIKEVEIE